MSTMLMSGSNQLKFHRRKKKNDVVPIPSRWRYVLELHLSGRSVSEIEEITGYASPTIYKIISDPKMVAEKQQIMRYYDSEFESLYHKVIDSVRNGLDSEEVPDQLNASKIWLKAHGKMQPDVVKSSETNLSAEKIVFQILNQARDDRKELSSNAQS